MEHSIQLKILDKRIGETIALPTYATEGSAGIDLRVERQETGLAT